MKIRRGNTVPLSIQVWREAFVSPARKAHEMYSVGGPRDRFLIRQVWCCFGVPRGSRKRGYQQLPKTRCRGASHTCIKDINEQLAVGYITDICFLAHHYFSSYAKSKHISFLCFVKALTSRVFLCTVSGVPRDTA